jgi:catechol 2,3-dioxygenase-like lactoylglutathione lyase family enzyme
VKPEDLYHIGIIVEDFAAAMAWYSETAGYQWCEPSDGESEVVTPDGKQTIPMCLTYSVDEPRLELVRAVPGTLWTPADSGIHHLGYWSDDVDADVAALVAAGLTLEVSGLYPDGSSMWAYCRAPGRPRTELVSRAMQPSMTEWFRRAC